MRIAGRRCVRIALLAGVSAFVSGAPVAHAQGPEFVAMGQGALPSLNYTWQALAVRPNQVFIDLYDHEGILRDTFTITFDRAPRKNTVTALGRRPFGPPTQAALVGGATGRRVKTVKIFFDGAPTQKLRTTKAPPEWGFAGRFFGTGATVAESSANTTQVVTLIKALDGKGRLLSKTESVFTNPF
jgi:hypothetical protein